MSNSIHFLMEQIQYWTSRSASWRTAHEVKIVNFMATESIENAPGFSIPGLLIIDLIETFGLGNSRFRLFLVVSSTNLI